MKYTLFTSVFVAAFFVAGMVHAAVYIKYEGVKGESATGSTTETELQIQTTSTTSGTTKTRTETTSETQKDYIYQNNETDLDFVKTKADDDSDGDGTNGGNVEFEWKVEEGESIEDDGIDDIDDSSDDDDDARGIKGGVSVAAGDVNGLTDEEKVQFMLTVKEHAQVQSRQDLENFAKGILLKDENVEEVFEDEDEAGISYRSEGKLFGIIPMTYRQKVSVNTAGEDKGRVKVKLPWFSFLLKKEFSVTGEEVEAEAKKEGGKDWIELESWSFAEKAEAFNTLSNVLKTKHDTVKNSINNVR